jgi:membrane protein
MGRSLWAALDVASVLLLTGAAYVGARRRPPRAKAAGAQRAATARGWKGLLVRTAREFSQDQVPMVSAGITFYTILALFPGMAALISLYGLIADPSDVPRHLQALSHVLPGAALTVIGDELTRLVTAKTGSLSLTAVIGLLASIWSANGAVKALMIGLTMAYGEKDSRGFLNKTLISLGFTLGFAVFGMIALGVLGAGPFIRTRLGPAAVLVFHAVSWPALLLVMSAGLALVYRFGAARRPGRFGWISWGSAGAVAVWFVMSAAYSLFVANFGHFDRTYGSLGAAIGFMMWIYLSAMVILAGAELNAGIEQAKA